jgi:hypothetical protein
MLPALLLLATAADVSGHGTVVWPPIWQDGHGLSIDSVYSSMLFSDPLVWDPNNGRKINKGKTWLADQSYLGGHGEEFRGVGEVTNLNKRSCGKKCRTVKAPWAAPGKALSFGGGCGIHGGNPFGCPAGNDTRPPGSRCGQFTPFRGTFTFGSSALDVQFPGALTTEWKLGSVQPVAFMTSGGHKGGYTYRLCKLPADGKAGLTEDCFARTVLEFAEPFTMMRRAGQANLEVEWTRYDQSDLSVGTHPEGSVWRHINKYGGGKGTDGLVRKDQVQSLI